MNLALAIVGVATNLLALSDSLLHDDAAAAYRLDATVCHIVEFPPPDGQLELALLDGSGVFALRIDRDGSPPGIAPGDILSLAGRADRRHPIFRHAGTVLRTGRVRAPGPVSATVSGILAGTLDHRFVLTSGILRSVFVSELNPQWIWLVIKVSGQNLYAATPRPKADADRMKAFLHREIELAGIVIPQDGSLRHRIGRVLHFNGLADIRSRSEADRDPFSAPELSSIGNLPPTEVAKLSRHRLSGSVRAVWNGNSAIVVDGRGDPCRVEFSSADAPPCGSAVDVLGYPESDLHHLNLSDAIWRMSPTPGGRTGRSDRPTEARPDGFFRRDRQEDSLLQGQLVRIKGAVIALPTPVVPEQRLLIESQGQIVPVNIGSAKGAFDGLRVGTEIEVTGVFVMDIENYRPSLLFPRVKGGMIVLRSSGDLRVLAHPSWWTPGRLTAAVCGLIAFLLGILVWNVSLSRIATRKSRALLKEQLGHVKAELKTEERTRLAVELHDSLAQNLTGVSLEIDTASKVADEDPFAMKAHLGIAARSLKSCRDELRNCLWDLRNRALEAKTMDAAIRQTLAPHAAGVDLSIRFSVPRERISDNTAHAILRIVRELTLNGIRHGGATKIRIAGSIDGDHMRFSVRDNGCGFDPEAAPGFTEGHYGLLGIRERIDEFEGQFTLQSSPGNGTRAAISILVPQET